jgi:hypothetical protein
VKYVPILAVLVLGRPASAQPPSCEASPRPDAGRICATLTVEGGKFAVSGDPVIVRNGLPDVVTDAQILASLQTALKEAGMPYQAGFSDDDRKNDALNTESKRVALRTMTSSWEAYVGAAADAGIDTDGMLDGISGMLGRLRQTAGFVTVVDANQVFNTETGHAQLDIVTLTDKVDIRRPRCAPT